MPHRHRNSTSTITLLLPSPTSSTSTSSTANQPTTEPVDIEVLILAKKIASSKNQKFDIESYLSDTQLEEYRTKYLGLPPKPVPAPAPEETKPGENATASATAVKDSTATAGPSTPVISVEVQSPTPTPPTTNATATTPGTPTTATPVKKPFKFPDLSHLHWKQRAKRLAELQREQEMIENGEITEQSSSVLDDPANASASTGKKGELTEKDKEGIRGSASYWNSLLISARKSRGPQWDYSLQQYQYDRFSVEYYTHGKDPRATPEPEPETKDEDQDKELLDANAEEGVVGNESPNKKRKLSLSQHPSSPNQLNNVKINVNEKDEDDTDSRKRIKSNSLPNSIPKQSPSLTNSTQPQQSQISNTPIGIGRPPLPSNSSSSNSSIPQIGVPMSMGIPSGINPQQAQGMNPNILASLQQFQAQQQQQQQQQNQQGGFNPAQIQMQLAGSGMGMNMNSQQLNGSGLNPQQLSGLNPQQLSGLGGLNPQQISGLNLNSQQLNGLNPQQLMGLSNMISSMNPQFLQQQQQQQGGGSISQHGSMQGLNMAMFNTNTNTNTGQTAGPMLGGTSSTNGNGNGNWSSGFNMNN
ncbi:uncharacterized protein L199_008338 [Kwoniella botswanensis]|uniref:uncharacterized protein n=1 Tax=Kwoniella botswanensis TaxID=1268659 RepID=UPI00315D133E